MQACRVHTLFTLRDVAGSYQVMEVEAQKLWHRLSGGEALFVISGPCVIESEELCLEVAQTMRDICAELNLTYIFKASFDKANRTSVQSERGPGLNPGLKILDAVRGEMGVPVLTDVHSEEQTIAAAKVVFRFLHFCADKPISLRLLLPQA